MDHRRSSALTAVYIQPIGGVPPLEVSIRPANRLRTDGLSNRTD